MRYLSLPELEQINALLSHIESDDGKAAGADKKLLKRLGERFGSPALGESHDELSAMVVGGADALLGSSPPAHTMASGDLGSDRLSLPLPPTSVGPFSLKLLYYLISTMNLVFPDYDFGELKPEAFTGHPQLATVISAVNTTLFNAGVSKNAVTFGDFSRALWERIDGAISLSDSEVYSYSVAADDEEENPFWEQGCIWSFNYFFWNRKLKRILLLTCRATSIMRDSDSSFQLESRSSTPLPTAHFSQWHKMVLSDKIKSMKFMKRKEDAEHRKQEEEQQRQIAQQGHWRLVTQAPVARQQPKFRVEYDGGLGAGPTQTTASAARHTFGKFTPCTVEGTGEATQVDDSDGTTKSKKGAADGSTALQKRPRE